MSTAILERSRIKIYKPESARIYLEETDTAKGGYFGSTGEGAGSDLICGHLQGTVSEWRANRLSSHPGTTLTAANVLTTLLFINYEHNLQTQRSEMGLRKWLILCIPNIPNTADNAFYVSYDFIKLYEDCQEQGYLHVYICIGSQSELTHLSNSKNILPHMEYWYSRVRTSTDESLNIQSDIWYNLKKQTHTHNLLALIDITFYNSIMEEDTNRIECLKPAGPIVSCAHTQFWKCFDCRPFRYTNELPPLTSAHPSQMALATGLVQI